MKILVKSVNSLIISLASLGASLLFVQNAFADIPPHHSESTPTSTVVDVNYGHIGIYLILTLLFELPIFYFLGLKSKKALVWATVVNIITVPSYQIMNSLMGGQLAHGFGLVFAELLITAIEALILVFFLKEIDGKKIIIATVAANAFSAIVGSLVVNNLLGGLS